MILMATCLPVSLSSALTTSEKAPLRSGGEEKTERKRKDGRKLVKSGERYKIGREEGNGEGKGRRYKLTFLALPSGCTLLPLWHHASWRREALSL